MANVTTRSGKGAELTWAELDANFTALAAAVNFLIPQDTAFATTVPLDGNRYMPQTNVTSNLTFTPAASPQKGAQVYLRLVANGTNTVTFTGFKEWGGSIGYDNRNGILNEIQFFHDGVDSWYSISQAVGEVAVDTTAPTISSAQVANAAPAIIVITMSETLAAVTPATSAFTVSGGKTVSSVSVSGSTVSVTVNSAYVNGDTITVAYTQPGTNNLQDAAGNAVATFGAQPVTNNVAPTDVTAPTLTAATVDGASLVLTYSEALQTALPATSSWSVVGAGGTTQAPSAVAISGSAVTLTLATPAVSGNTVTISYTVPGTNPIRDAAGNTAPALSVQAVTNNTAAPAADSILELTTLSNLTQGTGGNDNVYTAGSSLPNPFGAYGRSSLTLAADGYVSVDWPSATNGAALVGFDKTNSIDWGAGGDNGAPDAFLLLSTNTGNVSYSANNQTATVIGAALTPGAGVRYRLRRAGATITIEESSNSGATWNTRYTFAGSFSGTLYVWIATTASNVIYRPRQVGMA